MNDKIIKEPIMIYQELSLDKRTIDRVNDVNCNKRDCNIRNTFAK